MFNFFKNEPWIVSAKDLKAHRMCTTSKLLTKEEIKKEILKCEGKGKDVAEFRWRTISKKDEKTLTKLGYRVKVDAWGTGRTDVFIYW